MGLIPTIFLYLSVFSIAVLAAYISNTFIPAINAKEETLVLRNNKLVDVLYNNKLKIKINTSGNYFIVIIFSIIAIITPCILSSLRTDLVGPDTALYVTPNFNLVRTHNSMSFPEFYDQVSEQIELFFAVLVYLCAKINSFGLLLFLIQLFAIAPVYIALFLLRNQHSLTLGYFAYLCLFYNFSLSGMRQSIAEGFFILAFAFFYKKKYVHSLILILIATQFHNSAYIMSVLFLIIAVISKLYDSPKKKKLFFLIATILAAVLIFYRNIAITLAKIVHIFKPRYAAYITRYLAEKPSFSLNDIYWASFIPRIVFLVIGLCILLPKRHNKFIYNSYAITLLAYVAIGCYCGFMSANFYESERIAHYFDFFNILYLSYAAKCCKNNMNLKLLNTIVVLGTCFSYWLFFYMILGGYNTNNFCFR